MHNFCIIAQSNIHHLLFNEYYLFEWFFFKNNNAPKTGLIKHVVEKLSYTHIRYFSNRTQILLDILP